MKMGHKSILVVASALTAALAAGAAARAAANGDGYQFIMSGDPIAAAVADTSSASSGTIALVGGPLAGGVVYGSELEARFRTMDDSNLTSLRSGTMRGSMIVLF